MYTHVYIYIYIYVMCVYCLCKKIERIRRLCYQIGPFVMSFLQSMDCTAKVMS